MYTLTRDPSRPDASVVVRDADGAKIPSDPANADWQTYQAWLAAGNEPTPAPTPPPQPRGATGERLITALTDDQAKAIKQRDLLRLAARGSDLVPETSPVLARAAETAGTTPKDWLDAALA